MLTKSELTKLVGNSAGKKILCVGPDQGDVNMDDVPNLVLFIIWTTTLKMF